MPKNMPRNIDVSNQPIFVIYKVSDWRKYWDNDPDAMLIANGLTGWEALAHIGTDGNIRHHSIEEWANIVAKFGPDWLAPHLVIPDLLEDGFQWDGIQSPNLFSSIDEQKNHPSDRCREEANENR